MCKYRKINEEIADESLILWRMQQQFISVGISLNLGRLPCYFCGRIFAITLALFACVCVCVLNEGGILMAIDLNRLNRPCARI